MGLVAWRARVPDGWCLRPFVGPRGVFGQADARRYPVRATARARISQFAEANSTCRWLRFFAIPR